MASSKYLLVLASILALQAQGAFAIICFECRSAVAADGSDYCAEPSAEQLVACPITQTQCYSTLALINDRLIISRGCGRPPALPAAANLASDTCRAFGDLSATAIFCTCAGGACNNQTGSSPAVQNELRLVIAGQPNPNTNVEEVDNRHSRTLLPAGTSGQQQVVIISRPGAVNTRNTNNNVGVAIVAQATTTTTTTTTTEEPIATEAPATQQPQRINIAVPANTNTNNNAQRRVDVVDRSNNNANLPIVSYDTTTTTHTPVTNAADGSNTVIVPLGNGQQARIISPAGSGSARVVTTSTAADQEQQQQQAVVVTQAPTAAAVAPAASPSRIVVYVDENGVTHRRDQHGNDIVVDTTQVPLATVVMSDNNNNNAAAGDNTDRTIVLTPLSHNTVLLNDTASSNVTPQNDNMAVKIRNVSTSHMMDVESTTVLAVVGNVTISTNTNAGASLASSSRVALVMAFVAVIAVFVQRR